jgi:acetoin utilization deacetylase AcuC-like enzyme
MATTLLLSHRDLLNHIPGGDHPERPDRLRAILERFSPPLEKGAGGFSLFQKGNFERLATVDELSLVHTATYINHVLSLDGKNASLDYETLLSPGSVHAARLAAGLGLELVERIISGKASNGFALIRPAGHHARPREGMGFCVFNNIAIAAKKALALGLKRILIIDFDVHHGNGTQEVFYDDDHVMFIDIHQENLFPTTSGFEDEIGKGSGKGYTLNISLDRGCGDDEYLEALRTRVLPRARAFKPELILVSAGFDGQEDDPLAAMRISSDGFAQMVSEIKTLAEEQCGGKLALFLEGGYIPEHLAESVYRCVEVLCAQK